MLATTGATVTHPAFPATPELWLISTPFGCRGFFYEEWHRSDSGNPKSDWQRFSITADQCPRIPAAFLKEERNSLPQPRFEQEYFCQFIREGTNSLFRWKELQAALDPNIQPLFPNWSFTTWQHR